VASGKPPVQRPAGLAWPQVAGAVAVLCVLAVLAQLGSPGFPLAGAASAVGRVVNRALAGAPGAAIAPAADIPGIRASSLAIADIPPNYLGWYVQAADTCPALSWQLLAGIGKVETNHGRAQLPGVREGLNAAGCCAGPMQFNLTNGPPSTWQAFAQPGDSPYNPADAIPAAARKLCANGLAPTPTNRKWKGVTDADPCPQVRGSAAQHRALRRYNNACWYAHEVLTIAARYTLAPTPQQQASDPFVKALVANPNLATTSHRGCDPAPDLASGRLDLRVQSILSVLAERYQLRISCLQTGHSVHVKGTNRVSNHHVWRAVDIDQINGQPVSAANPSARELVTWLDRLQGPLRPTEVGSPFPIGHRPYFTDEGHQGHIHIGYSSDA
jgi:hypothetical protein